MNTPKQIIFSIHKFKCEDLICRVIFQHLNKYISINFFKSYMDYSYTHSAMLIKHGVGNLQTTKSRYLSMALVICIIQNLGFFNVSEYLDATSSHFKLVKQDVITVSYQVLAFIPKSNQSNVKFGKINL